MTARREFHTAGFRSLILAAALANAGAATAQQSWISLKQGWSSNTRNDWYNLSQGSRLIPESWLMALEQPETTALFLDSANIAKFGYIPRPGTGGKPGLPVGFAKDESSDVGYGATRLRWLPNQNDRQPWIGFNCAACHTAELRHEGKTIRIEGGPTSADFQSFFVSFNRALRQTRGDAAKFDRFAVKILGTGPSQANRARLQGELDKLIAWQDGIEKQNATKLNYGHARLDAVGHILNKVAISAKSTPLVPFPADAPVSYPVIWNAPQHVKIQWNGLTENSGSPIRIFGKDTDFGALGRNAGEAIGVFADLTTDSVSLNGYRSSIDVKNLIWMERSLKTLWSPVWPEDTLGKLDRAKVAAGKALYEEVGCGECHNVLAPTDMVKKAKERMWPLRTVGTDIWMACNAWDYSANAGLLAGVKLNIISGKRHGETSGGANMLKTAVTGALLGKGLDIISSLVSDLFGTRESVLAVLPPPLDRLTPARGFPDDPVKRARAEKCLGSVDDLLAYKARPLNGIWASAPYLHNGSVPTLYDLLTPAKMPSLSTNTPAPPVPDGLTRPERFFVGSQVIDTKKVGINTDKATAGNTFEFRTHGDDGLEILGNSNAGHPWGTMLTHEERMALIEYLKTL